MANHWWEKGKDYWGFKEGLWGISPAVNMLKNALPGVLVPQHIDQSEPGLRWMQESRLGAGINKLKRNL